MITLRDLDINDETELTEPAGLRQPTRPLVDEPPPIDWDIEDFFDGQ